jgi:hypothetical protein
MTVAVVALAVLLLVTRAQVAAATGEIHAVVGRVAHDEQATCAIQARGLPAGHQLAASMRDIHKLLTTPPTTRAQRLAATQRPRAVTALLKSLDAHLAAYLQAEAKQPQTRACS